MSDRYRWHAGNNGANKMRWFVCRDRMPDDPERGRRGSMDYVWNANGRLRRFASMAAAQKVADELNVLWSELEK